MADITMCEGLSCPLKESCHRFTANKNELYQSYFVDIPYDNEKKECKYYWKEENKI